MRRRRDRELVLDLARMDRRKARKDAVRAKSAAKGPAKASGKPVDGVPAKPRPLVSRELLARARARYSAPKAASISVEDLLRPATPPPGVVPKDAPVLAMDEQPFNNFSSWAGSYYPSAIAEGQAFLGYPYLSELLQRAEYRRMVEQIATQMCRKWIRFTTTTDGGDLRQRAEDDPKAKGRKGAKDPAGPLGEEDDLEDDAAKLAGEIEQKRTAKKLAAKIKKIEAEFKRLGVREAFEKAAAHDGGFGRGHIYLDTGDNNKADEIITDIGDGQDQASRGKVSRKHPLVRLKNVEPVWSYPAFYNATDPLDPAWYRPTEWYVMARRVHASRLLTFIGREVPDMLKPAYSFGGLSLVQMAKPYVDNWLRVRQSVSDIVNAFSVMVLSTDLQTTTQPDGSSIFERLDLFNVLRDNAGVMAINEATEDFQNVAAPLGTLDQLQAQAQEHMAAVSGIPIVFLLGIAPHGMNATAEGEIRVFYDWIASYQEHLFRPNLTRVLGFVQLSLFGEVDPNISFEFEPLWSLDEKGLAEVRKVEAETDAIDIDKGVIDPAERRKRLIDDPDSPYQGLDPDDLPDLKQEEEDGLQPGKSAGERGMGGSEHDDDSARDVEVGHDQSATGRRSKNLAA